MCRLQGVVRRQGLAIDVVALVVAAAGSKESSQRVVYELSSYVLFELLRSLHRERVVSERPCDGRGQKTPRSCDKFPL